MESRLTKAIAGTRDLASRNADIKAIVSFGSTNRKKADENSDLDIFLFTTHSDRYLNRKEGDWLTKSFGPVLSRVVVKDLLDQILFNRIVLKNKFSLDIITVNSNEFTQARYFLWLKKFHICWLIPKKMFSSLDEKLYTFHYYLKRGYAILYDEVHIEELIKQVFEGYKQEFFKERDHLVNYQTFWRNYHQFWQSCYRMELALKSGQYFQALNIHDNNIKKSLIQLVHWHTLYTAGSPHMDVYYKGAKIYDWCDQSLIQQLYQVFPSTNLSKMRKALQQSILIYQQLSPPIAQSAGFAINTVLEKMVSTNKNLQVGRTVCSIEPGKDKILAPLIKLLAKDTPLLLLREIAVTHNVLDVQLFMAVANPGQFMKEQVWQFGDQKLISYLTVDKTICKISLLYESGLSITVILCPLAKLKKNQFYTVFKKLHSGVLYAARQDQKDLAYFGDFDSIGSSVIIDRVGISNFTSAHPVYEKPAFFNNPAYQEMFYANYNQFWQYCYKMMVKLIRKDFYYAIYVLDNNIKKRLAEMIDWYNLQVIYSDQHTIAESDIARMIANGIYPGSTIKEMKSSILQTILVYKNISHQVASWGGLSLNPEFEKLVELFINDNLSIH